MSVRRQPIPGLFLFAVVGSVLALPGTASAAPAAPAPAAPVPAAPVPAAPVPPVYPPQAPSASVSTTTPRVGSRLGVSYQNFQPFERISVDAVPGFRHLGAFRSDGTGSGAGSVRIPSGLRGTQVLIFTGLSSARVTTVVIDVLGPEGGSANPGGGAGGPAPGAPGGSSGNAGRAGGSGSGSISGSQNSAATAGGGLASTGFSTMEYVRIAGGLILAGAALGLLGRRARRRKASA